MGWHPVNLALRFGLEMVMLAAYVLWGLQRLEGAAGYALGIGLALGASLLWGLFRVPGDQSSKGGAPVPVPGVVRLALELVLFAGAVLVLLDAGYETAGVALAIVTLLHYLASYDRVAWLLQR